MCQNNTPTEKYLCQNDTPTEIKKYLCYFDTPTIKSACVKTTHPQHTQMADKNDFKVGDGSRIIVRGTDQFNRYVKSINQDFINDTLKELEKMDTKSGQVVSDNKKNRTFVATINGRIRKILQKLGYFQSVSDFTFNFNTLSRYITWVQKDVNDIAIRSALITPFRNFAVQSVLFNLQGQGLNAQLIKPIEQELRKAVRLGGNWVDMSNNVESFLSAGKNGKLGRLAELGSMDALGQFNGFVNEKIRTEFDLDVIRYVGSTVTDTRPQCLRWTKMKEIPFDDLPNEIAWAQRNGSGWIMGTIPGTFLQNRGGHRCRHEGIPTRSKKED